MSTYITLSRLQVQNANCIAGLTYGFPAITHFMGYIHALSRKLQKSHQLSLEGCAIICHQHQVHAYQPKGYGEYVFAQTRNPLTRKGDVAPIMEEGRMHLTVSLITRCEGMISGGDEGAAQFKKVLEELCLTQKLAGGVINRLQSVHIDSGDSGDKVRALNQRMLHRLLPGFVLIDQSAYLKKYWHSCQESTPEISLFDAWLDFISLRYKAEPQLAKDEVISNKTKASWKYVPKPEPGYLVPLMTGYKAISALHEAGTFPDTRDSDTPFRFVETVYGLGEWKSPHRLQTISDALWFYQQEDDWYLCGNETFSNDHTDENDDSFDFL